MFPDERFGSGQLTTEIISGKLGLITPHWKYIGSGSVNPGQNGHRVVVTRLILNQICIAIPKSLKLLVHHSFKIGIRISFFVLPSVVHM